MSDNFCLPITLLDVLVLGTVPSLPSGEGGGCCTKPTLGDLPFWNPFWRLIRELRVSALLRSQARRDFTRLGIVGTVPTTIWGRLA